MSLIPAGVLTDLRNIIASTLDTDTATVDGGDPVGVRILDGGSDMHLEGLPSYVTIRKWRLVFDRAVAVQNGSSIVVSGKGTYIALSAENDTDSPVTYSVSMTTFCVCPAQAFNGQTVTFRRTGQTDISVPVNIYGAWRDAALGEWIEQYDWAVVWHTPDALFGDGSQVAANDQMVWSEVATTGHLVTLERPRRGYTPVPYTVAYFKELGASSI